MSTQFPNGFEYPNIGQMACHIVLRSSLVDTPGERNSQDLDLSMMDMTARVKIRRREGPTLWRLVMVSHPIPSITFPCYRIYILASSSTLPCLTRDLIVAAMGTTVCGTRATASDVLAMDL